MTEDINRGAAIAHRAIKSAAGAKKDFVQPTRMIKDGDGKLTADPKEVHKEFTQQWSDKVFNLDRRRPQWREFQEQYRNYINWS